MTDFDYDVMLRKRLAGQAKHKKNGSKSRKCSLPTDHMTRKQWERKCGEIVSYQLGSPMGWSEFKQMPKDLQKTYLEGFIEKYHANAKDLAWMFGCTSATVIRYCDQNGLGVEFPRGRRMSAEQRSEFEHLVNGDKVLVLPSDSPVLVSDAQPSESKAGMVMDGVTLHFTGCFDKSMLYNSLLSIVPEGTEVEITLRCSILNAGS